VLLCRESSEKPGPRSGPGSSLHVYVGSMIANATASVFSRDWALFEYDTGTAEFKAAVKSSRRHIVVSAPANMSVHISLQSISVDTMKVQSAAITRHSRSPFISLGILIAASFLSPP
jgi:hypothetical protein